MSYLLLCTRLEKLKLLHCKVKSSADSHHSVAAIEAGPEIYLPRLMVLKIGLWPNPQLTVGNWCIGEWSRLLEKKRPLLKKVSLCCSHINTRYYPFKWSHVPFLWPNLEKLHLVGSAKGLSLDTCRLLIKGLPKLKDLKFPCEENPERFINEMKLLEPHINISYHHETTSCTYP